MKTVVHGMTEPRIWTRPLRDLTKDTSLGFEVIDFAKQILGIELRPWQQWLLTHALELMPDGSYRFRKVIVLVARQNGKTMLASVLACWWLLVDSQRHPDRVPPVKFKIVGTAQNLDIAREPWQQVGMWCDPEPVKEEDAAMAIPALQAATSATARSSSRTRPSRCQSLQAHLWISPTCRPMPAAIIRWPSAATGTCTPGGSTTTGSSATTPSPIHRPPCACTGPATMVMA